jgi:hypothetical protein
VNTEKRQGPKLSIVSDCGGCAFLHGEHYAIEDGNDYDSGTITSCTHEAAPRPTGRSTARIGDSVWTTPRWCPLLEGARAEFLRAGGAS